VSDIAAGLSIFFAKPFRVGEFISIAGKEGVIEDITLLTTTLSHVDEARVVIPNRKILGEILHNFRRLRQLEIVVGVAYDTDFDVAFATVDHVLRNNPRVLRDPAPMVQTLRLADSCVEIAIKPWVAVHDCAAALGEINKAVLEAFRSHGIAIPFPQREIRHRFRADAAADDMNKNWASAS
jgi:small conductance mechanosensitive channel